MTIDFEVAPAPRVAPRADKTPCAVAGEKSNHWFRDAGLGLFVHWGVYSVLGRGEWVIAQENMALAEYDRAAPGFTAAAYDPDDWAKLARAVGMRYMVLTAKHHDGFCLFDTATTRRNAAVAGPGRDLVRPFVEAARREGLRVGLYFSLSDWSVPAFNAGPEADPAGWDAFVDYTHRQVAELCGNYGAVDLLWYDQSCRDIKGHPLTPEHFRAAELNAAVRRLQPGILINNRSFLPEDFHTAEQRIEAPENPDRLWEACLTMNRHWGHCPGDNEYKSVFELLMSLTAAASGGGRLLLNVGPRPDGTIGPIERERLLAVGEWMKANGEAIYGARRSGLSGGSYGCAATIGDAVYLFLHWPGDGRVTVPRCSRIFTRATLLENGRELALDYRDGNLHIEGPPPLAPGRCTRNQTGKPPWRLTPAN